MLVPMPAEVINQIHKLANKKYGTNENNLHFELGDNGEYHKDGQMFYKGMTKN